ncbi:hypothetical protein KO561_03710 [Radiobacillus kanasensis]|uniref:hypothetical protein n=1 Tax=Radiobacillus kanasensis TaxID=2844358 RepID=UPI001E37EB8C|nr:hypothetical protein [Radiobacillus kanasensis]UFU00082.1 hypothetical protein KO561_03710 [Radiobacillus kanasensis]
MEVILTSFFSAIIIMITVYSILKALHIGYKRKEISIRKYWVYASSTVVIGLAVASTLPFAFQKIYEMVLQ